jgi:hypothetical protein
MEIPDAWAEKGHCPICNKATLRVVHHDGQPDQLACVSCGCSFEIEADGPNIRMDRIGPDYKVKLQVADGIWMSVVEIHQQLIQQTRQDNTGIEPNPVETSVEKVHQSDNTKGSNESKDTIQAIVLNQEEVNRRAIGLAALGNRPASIRSTLTGSGISAEMVTIALEEVKSRKIKRKSPLPLALAVTIIVVVGCLSAAAIYLPKFNLRALIGPITNPLAAPHSSQQAETTASISAGTGLPADGTRYFNVVWNLTGSFNDKADQIGFVVPPNDLAQVHMQLVESFHQTGSLEVDYQKCLAEYDLQKCYETQTMDSTVCKDKSAECSKANLLFLEEKTKLYNLWLGTACKSFEDYYSKNNVVFPFPPGNCNYP